MKRTLTEAHVYMRHHQNVRVKHFDVSNVIYHKFSHDAFSYRLNGKNVNVMLELMIMLPLHNYLLVYSTKTVETVQLDVVYCV